MRIIVLQIVMWALATGLVGFLSGWFLSRITHSVKSVEVAGQLRDKLKNSEEALAAVRDLLSAEQHRASSLQEELTQALTALSAREEALAEAEDCVRELERRLSEVERAAAAQASELDSREVALEKAAAALAQQNAEIKRLRREAGEEELRYTQWRAAAGISPDFAERHRPLPRGRTVEAAELQARVTELEMIARQGRERTSEMQTGRRLVLAQAVGAGDTPPPGGEQEQDDLKQIFGIGPALERLLNSRGIYRFRQIAEWTEREIHEFDAQHPPLRGRIRRDNWIAGAKEAHFKKYGERL